MKDLRGRKIDLVGKLTPRFEEEDLDYILRSYLEDFMEKEKELPGGFLFGFVGEEMDGRTVVCDTGEEMLVDKNCVRITKKGNVQNFIEIVSMVDFLEKYVVGNENAGYVPSARMQNVFEELDKEEGQEYLEYCIKNGDGKTKQLFPNCYKKIEPGILIDENTDCAFSCDGIQITINKNGETKCYNIKNNVGITYEKAPGETREEILEAVKKDLEIVYNLTISSCSLSEKDKGLRYVEFSFPTENKGSEYSGDGQVSKKFPVEKVSETFSGEIKDDYVPGPAATIADFSGALYLIEKITENEFYSEIFEAYFYRNKSGKYVPDLVPFEINYGACELYKIIAARDINDWESQRNVINGVICPVFTNKQHVNPVSFLIEEEVEYLFKEIIEGVKGFYVWPTKTEENISVDASKNVTSSGPVEEVPEPTHVQECDKCLDEFSNKLAEENQNTMLYGKKDGPAIDNPETPVEDFKILEGRINFCDIDLDNSYILCKTREDVENILACYNPSNETPEDVGVHALYKEDWFMYIVGNEWHYCYTPEYGGDVLDIRKTRTGIRAENIDFVTEKQMS